MGKEFSEGKLYAAVYMMLIGFTVLTVTASQMNLVHDMRFGRFLAVLIALSIAGFKAALIAFYYMHLRFEKALIYGIVLVGIVTVAILAVGIFPDIGLRL